MTSECFLELMCDHLHCYNVTCLRRSVYRSIIRIITLEVIYSVEVAFIRSAYADFLFSFQRKGLADVPEVRDSSAW
jgi:hypothetical protein